MAANPPPLVSPIPALEVRAVLDQDALLTAGLTHAPGGQRVVLLVSAGKARPGEREEFAQWCRALTDVSTVARTAAVADFGHTEDGRPFLATYVNRSLADQMRLVGPPDPTTVRLMGATIADALAAAHSYGLVHAAVSPATVMMVDDGVRLGGFGATAPGLTGPLGVWAFTAPEHRAAAAAGESTGSAAGDVFALAATVCVALAGVLPWSDPVSWADAAGLEGGLGAPRWMTTVRAALDADPDRRPSAEEMAEALRSTAAPLLERPPGAKVDLRGLIPRKVRRLAAYSIDAMADGPTPVVGRAKPGAKTTGAAPEDAVTRSPRSRLAALIRSHRVAAGALGAVAALLLGAGAYALAVSGGSSGTGKPGAVATTDAAVLAALLTGARETGENFLHDVGNGSADACATAQGNTTITVPHSTAPVTCAYLVAHAARLLSDQAVLAMRTAEVTQAAGYDTGGIPDPLPHAVITLPAVPALQSVFTRFEMDLTYQEGQWWVMQVTFA